ncbi:hypothetical protein CCUS01_07399 [Colletotrichum cuscutae]|uniref:Uncharacterized protein n=1 Tax=Colletotrichum cuscutae TaxID=1209917 RepID=A0AAI9XZG6_9PEZI|nr:hypothetical protein CCUS01_07399 [Colletotrichum cuscutae]
MILRALSPDDPSHLEKNLYLGRAWEAINIPGYLGIGKQGKTERSNGGDATRNVLAGPVPLSHPWAKPSDVAHQVENQSPTGKAQGKQGSEYNHEKSGSNYPPLREDQNRATAEQATIRASSGTLYSGNSNPPPGDVPRPWRQAMHASEGRSSSPAGSMPPATPAEAPPVHSEFYQKGRKR